MEGSIGGESMYVSNSTGFLAPSARALHGMRSNRLRQRLRTLHPSSHVFREGDEAENLYEVISGVLRLTRVLENGRRQVIAFGYPGDFVGFPNGTRHHTDCDGVTEAEVAIYRSAALADARLDPSLHRRMVQAALREISGMQDHFMTLGCKSATEKLASFLLTLAQRVGQRQGPDLRFELPMLRSDIADFLGLTPETVSRTFTQLRSRGIIAIDKVNTVILVDPAALQALAEAD